MQTDKELKAAFRKRAQTILPPAGLDRQIAGIYENFVQTQSRHPSRPGTLSRLRSAAGRRTAIIALCFCLFSGIAYASNALYKVNTSNLKYEMTIDPNIALPSSTAEQIRNVFDGVRSSLGEDEKALVFVSLLDREKLPAFASVSNPRIYTDLAQWKQVVGYHADWSLPGQLPDGYSIAGGRTQLPVEGGTLEWMKRYERTLKEEAKRNGQPAAWTKIEASDNAGSTGVYVPNMLVTKEGGAEITASWQVIPEGTNVEIHGKSGNGTMSEKVTVSGKEAAYMYSSDNFLSRTGYVQHLSWADEVNGKSILYQLSSESADVSKEDLLYIANHMK
ncbi:MAG: hypothetical protein K0Q94_5280 [Paenibacillus sp.]|jgi:hypothetical protein|uniref:hypothetical protein n=1 Tax=Paenibacillus sp. GCM10012303 TaxID=3317340 RepID=UPI0029EE2E72|nr:hypothetical protein [Paenibacillus sp.]